MTTPAVHRPMTRGFTLIEVLIAMLVTAVGLLGLAKMQALAISGTQNSGSRSLMALQVGSLVSAMHANQTYWGSAPPTSFSATGTTVTDASSVLNATVTSCTTKCTPAAMAASDFQAWAASMNGQFPTYNAKINCTAVQPVSCEIYVSWTEKKVAMSTTTAAGTASQTQSFSVFVEP